jgi:hypothetical protein
MKYKINWWGVVFICFSSIFYTAGREDGRNAQIRESIPTQAELDEYNEVYMKEMLNICKEVWESNKQDTE